MRVGLFGTPCAFFFFKDIFNYLNFIFKIEWLLSQQACAVSFNRGITRTLYITVVMMML